ncbi:MAG: tetratricopeptide repeat protein [Kiritimatiellales bacterium]
MMRTFLFILLIATACAAQAPLPVEPLPTDTLPELSNEKPGKENKTGPQAFSEEPADDNSAYQITTDLKKPDVETTGTVSSAENPAAAIGSATPEDSRVAFLMNVGVQYSDEGEYADAEKAYLRALEKDPENPDIRFRLSTLYILMGKFQEAADLLKKMVVEFPDNPLIQNNLAWVYATGGELRNSKLALRYARESLLLAPMSPSMWNTLAEAYYLAGDYEKAMRSSKVALDQLQRGKPTEDEVKSFQMQQVKIQRATDALKTLEGRDDE